MNVRQEWYARQLRDHTQLDLENLIEAVAFAKVHNLDTLVVLYTLAHKVKPLPIAAIEEATAKLKRLYP